MENPSEAGIGQAVAQHYNNLDEKGREQRKDSRIYYMRNFNNWTKSMLIQEYSDKVKDSRPELRRNLSQTQDRGRGNYRGGGYGNQSIDRNYHDRRGSYSNNYHGRNEKHGDKHNRYENRNHRDNIGIGPRDTQNRTGDREEHDKRKQDSNLDNQFSVLDLGCGKGGDLLKWSKAGVDEMTCVDIAETSVEQAKERYHQMKQKNRGRLFTSNFFDADCTKTRLLDRYPKNQDGASIPPKFDIVSCQFAFHYSFESETQAECMVKNAAECLKPGGYFIGTTPDAEVIFKRLREKQASSSEESNKFGNSIYSVQFDETSPILKSQNSNEGEVQSKLAAKMPKDLPKFGVGYNFHLEGVVDCPEFLVNFDALCDIAERHGLQLVAKQGFENFFVNKRKTREGANLLRRINALESYPPRHGQELVADTDNYLTAKKYLEKLKDCRDTDSHTRTNIKPDREPVFVLEDRDGRDFQLGTLSREEWEAITLYCVFAFKKKK